MIRVTSILAVLAFCTPGMAQLTVPSDHYDSSFSAPALGRQAWQNAETVITTANAATGSMQRITSCPLDSSAVANIISINGITIGGKTHNAVLAVSAGTGDPTWTGNIVYLFDVSNPPACAVLWTRQLTVNTGSHSNYPALNGCIGTPTYDAADGWIFIACKDDSQAVTLYQLAAATGAVNASVALSGSASGIGDQFLGIPIYLAAQTGSATGCTNGTYSNIALNQPGGGTGAVVSIHITSSVIDSLTITAAGGAPGGTNYSDGVQGGYGNQTFTVSASVGGCSGLQIKATIANVYGIFSGFTDTIAAGAFPFLPTYARQRSGLTLVTSPAGSCTVGCVIVETGGNLPYGDQHPWHGWVLAYNKTTLAPVWSVCLSPNGYGASPAWNGERGPVVDANGVIYIATGNGDNALADGLQNGCNYPTAVAGCDFGSSVVAISPSGVLLGAYIANQSGYDDAAYKEANDQDLMGLIGITGPSGALYLMTWDKGGNFWVMPASCVQTSNCTPAMPTTDGNDYRTAAFVNGNLYLSDAAGHLAYMPWNSSTGAFGSMVTASSTGTAYLSGLVGSSNGASNGIVWTTSGAPGLMAFRASDLSLLWAGSDVFSFANSFISPVALGGGLVGLPVSTGPFGTPAINVYGLASRLTGAVSRGGGGMSMGGGIN